LLRRSSSSSRSLQRKALGVGAAVIAAGAVIASPDIDVPVIRALGDEHPAPRRPRHRRGLHPHVFDWLVDLLCAVSARTQFLIARISQPFAARGYPRAWWVIAGRASQ
jgi:hypothetical protein